MKNQVVTMTLMMILMRIVGFKLRSLKVAKSKRMMEAMMTKKKEACLMKRKWNKVMSSWLFCLGSVLSKSPLPSKNLIGTMTRHPRRTSNLSTASAIELKIAETTSDIWQMEKLFIMLQVLELFLILKRTPKSSSINISMMSQEYVFIQMVN